jgi:hypothetical protein
VAPNPKDQKWFSLAEQTSTETDQAKLIILVNQLCAALDERMAVERAVTQGLPDQQC